MSKTLAVLVTLSTGHALAQCRERHCVPATTAIANQAIAPSKIRVQSIYVDGGFSFIAPDGTAANCFAPSFGSGYIQCDAIGFYMPTATYYGVGFRADESNASGSYGWNANGAGMSYTPGSLATEAIVFGTRQQFSTQGRLLPANPDGGSPYGPVHLIQGYSPLSTNAVNDVVTVREYPQVRPLRIGFESQVLGVGVGNFTVEVFDVTTSTSLCTSGNIACTLAVGGSGSSSDCASRTAANAAGDDVRLRVNCGSCTTCPLGNAWAEMQSVPGT